MARSASGPRATTRKDLNAIYGGVAGARTALSALLGGFLGVRGVVWVPGVCDRASLANGAALIAD